MAAGSRAAFASQQNAIVLCVCGCVKTRFERDFMLQVHGSTSCVFPRLLVRLDSNFGLPRRFYFLGIVAEKSTVPRWRNGGAQGVFFKHRGHRV
jgi:hypothetical protein